MDNSFGEGRKVRARIVYAAATLLVIGAGSSFAGGDRANVRGMGMARSYVAASRGMDAVSINPALLAMKEDLLTLSLAPFGIHAGSDFLTLGLYRDYFVGVETGEGRVGKHLQEADKQRILDAFRGDVGEVTVDASVRLAGVSYQIPSVGGFAVTITDQIAGLVSVPSDYVRFGLYGNTPGSAYDFSQTGAKVSWLREYALSFGGTIPHPEFMQWLSVGVAAKIVQGYGYYEIQKFNTSLATSDNGTLTGRIGYHSRLVGVDPTARNSGFTVLPFGMPVYGNGTGFDFGIAGGFGNFMTVGMSITDIGKVNWEGRIEETYADTSLSINDPREVANGNIIENALKGHKREGKPFSSHLPTTFRLGVAIQMDRISTWIPGELLLATDYNQGLVDAPGTTLHGRFSIGFEWKLLKFLPLRSGVSFGGTDRLNYALGFGFNLGFFDLDVATENMELLWAGDGVTHGSVAVGTRFRF